MNYLLFAIYLLFFCWLITSMRFIKHAGLSDRTIIILFLIKVTAGVLVGWLSATYYPEGNDYWNLNKYGREEYQLLINDPAVFFTNIVHTPYADGYGGFFRSVGSYWKDLGGNLIIKLLALLNIFTRGNYYINSIFFSFISFTGCIALYRSFSFVYKRESLAGVIGCFLLPSSLYFGSGIHKDTLIFTMAAIFSYCVLFITSRKQSGKLLFFAMLSAVVILLIRNYVLFALLAACVAFVLAKHLRKTRPVFLIVYGSLLLLMLINAAVFPGRGPVNLIAQKQKDFLALPDASSEMTMKVLEPNIQGLISNTPSALNHAFFRPYPWEFPGFLVIPAIELWIYLALFLWLIFRYRPLTNMPFIWYSVCFALVVILFAGFIVPNAGSLVRYRGLYYPFLITPLLYAIPILNKHIKL